MTKTMIVNSLINNNYIRFLKKQQKMSYLIEDYGFEVQ